MLVAMVNILYKHSYSCYIKQIHAVWSSGSDIRHQAPIRWACRWKGNQNIQLARLCQTPSAAKFDEVENSCLQVTDPNQTDRVPWDMVTATHGKSLGGCSEESNEDGQQHHAPGGQSASSGPRHIVPDYNTTHNQQS